MARQQVEANDDEFAVDDSFLEDFDVDAAVAAATTSTAAATTSTTMVTTPSSSTNQTSLSPVLPPPTKRAKISPDNYSSNINNNNNNNNHHHDDLHLEDCLERYFGFRSFREGQKEAIQAVLDGKDVAIFWATGSGKSLTFILPPLFTTTTNNNNNKVALIISPLISLMQDQVHKLNGLLDNNENGHDNVDPQSQQQQQQSWATYLGSGQLDRHQEERALRGECRWVFCTPEKLQTDGFLDRIADQVNLSLIAIDEAHCVSDWGHDFRPDYRATGKIIRQHPKLLHVPLMALTATAVPRIQQDILSTLHMRKDTVVLSKTFDRPNLTIKVLSKDSASGSGSGSGTSNSIRAAMEPLIQRLKQEEDKGRGVTNTVASTIIYAPTKAQVEQICHYLQQRLSAEPQSKVQVAYYHGDLSATQRQQTHIQFLTGKTAVVVATIAFGMGIDKPDTRRVIHFGPPKTVEEYYQQIGRAGRDGLQAECTMYVARSDFDKYMSDFYLGSLQPKARQATIHSIQALKRMALDKETCRRKALLDFFEEKPTFGDHCGTCDVCQARQHYGDDTTRDFGPVARLILLAISKLREQGMTTVLQVLGGKMVEDYRYQRGVNPNQCKVQLEQQRSKLPHKVTQDQLKEFITALIQADYLSEVTKRSQVNGYSRTWVVFHVTGIGYKALQQGDQPISLPVPDSIRQAEKQEEIRKQRILQQLQDSGVELDQLPQKEIEQGDGEVIRAYLTWNRRLETLEKMEKNERLSQLQELLQCIQEWRNEAASRLVMAPASVLPEHVLYSVAYTAQSLPPGMSITVEDLQQSGARNRELQSLVQVINSWLERYQPSTGSGGAGGSDEPSSTTTNGSVVLTFPPGPIQPAKWAYAVYKPQKKTGLASWESSYLRFEKGESPTSIAMSPVSGRPLSVTTVLGHIQEAVLQGRPVDLQRLASFSSHMPTKSEWVQLEMAEQEMGMDVAGDPTTSGMNGSKYAMTDMLRPIMGNAFCDTPYIERDEQEKHRFSEWCERLKWYQLLKRAGMTAQFE